MKVLLAVVVAVLVLTAIQLIRRLLSRRMTRLEFQEVVRSWIERDYPGVSVKGVADFALLCDLCDGEVCVMLDTAFLQYLHKPRHLEDIVDDYVSSMAKSRLDQPVAWKDAKRRLLPLLQLEGTARRVDAARDDAESADEVVTFDFEYGLETVLLLDLEYASRPITPRDLKQWRISAQDALECAKTNLAVKTGPLWEPATDFARRNGFFRFHTMDGYDTARILLADLPDRVGRALGCERLAVTIPARGILLATPADSEESVAELRTTSALIYRKSIEPLSLEVFFLTGNE